MIHLGIDIKVVSPEEVFEMLSNVHPRYKGLWSDEHMKRHAALVEQGYVPIAWIDSEGILYDGALALSGIFESEKPSKCVIIHYPSDKHLKWRMLPISVQKIAAENLKIVKAHT